MPVRVAVNASPLIFLTKAGLLDLLRRLFDEVYTTTSVIEEIKYPLTLGIEAPEISEILRASWLKIVELSKTDKVNAEKLANQLKIQEGEAEVAVIYQRQGLDAIIVGDEVAEARLKRQGIFVKDITDVGILAASKGLYELQAFLEAVFEAGYRTKRVRDLLSQ